MGCHRTATGGRGLQPGPPRVGCGLGQKRVLAGTRSERHPSGDSVPGPRPGPEDVGYDAGRDSLYQTYSFFHRFEIISKRRVNRKKKKGESCFEEPRLRRAGSCGHSPRVSSRGGPGGRRCQPSTSGRTLDGRGRAHRRRAEARRSPGALRAPGPCAGHEGPGSLRPRSPGQGERAPHTRRGPRPARGAPRRGRRPGGRAGHARHRSRRARVHAERWQGPRRPKKGLLRAPGPAGPRKTEQQDAAPRQPYTLGQDERGGGPGTAPSDSTSSSTEKWVTPQPQAPTHVSPAAVTSRAALDAELPEARPPPPTSPRQSSRD